MKHEDKDQHIPLLWKYFLQKKSIMFHHTLTKEIPGILQK